jgi:hypothetical protein
MSPRSRRRVLQSQLLLSVVLAAGAGAQAALAPGCGGDVVADSGSATGTGAATGTSCADACAMFCKNPTCAAQQADGGFGDLARCLEGCNNTFCCQPATCLQDFVAGLTCLAATSCTGTQENGGCMAQNEAAVACCATHDGGCVAPMGVCSSASSSGGG